MPSLDSIFNRNPNTPAQVDMPATLGSSSAPLLLFGALDSTLWINVGVRGTLTVNGATFTDNGWTMLAQIVNFPATFSSDPTTGGYIYQTLTGSTKTAVLAKLAAPAANGAQQKMSQAFYPMLNT